MTDEMSLAVFDPIRLCTEEVQKKDAALEIDHTTPDGEKELRVWVKTVKGYLVALEKIRVKAKADSLEYGRAVDKKAKELKAPFSTIITDRMKPLDEIEDAKRAAAEAIIEAECAANEKAEAERLADLKKREEEVARKEAEIKVAEDAANAEQQEADRVIREKRIADSAAQTAREEAEEKAKAEADEKERVRLADEAKVRQDKEQAEDSERKRLAGSNHRADVEEKIRLSIARLIGSSSASYVIDALIANEIPHVTINY